MQIYKVKAGTSSKALAAAVAGTLVNKEDTCVKLCAIGAGAVNQMVKAVVLAKDFAAEDDVKIKSQPEFEIIEADGKELTTINYIVEAE